MSTLLLGEEDDDGVCQHLVYGETPIMLKVPMLVDGDAVHLETEERGF